MRSIRSIREVYVTLCRFGLNTILLSGLVAFLISLQHAFMNFKHFLNLNYLFKLLFFRNKLPTTHFPPILRRIAANKQLLSGTSY